MKTDDIYEFISQNNLECKIIESSLYNDSVNRKPFKDDVVRCYAVNADPECFGIRVNTIISYCAANQKVWIELDNFLIIWFLMFVIQQVWMNTWVWVTKYIIWLGTPTIS